MRFVADADRQSVVCGSALGLRDERTPADAVHTHADIPDVAADFNTFLKVKESSQTSDGW